MSEPKKRKKSLQFLNFCSNKIIGGGHVLIYRGFAPVMISDDVVPTVWLSMEVPNNRIAVVMDGNTSLNDQVKIKEDVATRTTTITVGDVVLLNATMRHDGVCIVDKADLRPMGINVYGDENKLMVGHRNLSNNTIVGGEALIRIGEDMPSE